MDKEKSTLSPEQKRRAIRVQIRELLTFELTHALDDEDRIEFLEQFDKDTDTSVPLVPYEPIGWEWMDELNRTGKWYHLGMIATEQVFGPHVFDPQYEATIGGPDCDLFCEDHHRIEKAKRKGESPELIASMLTAAKEHIRRYRGHR